MQEGGDKVTALACVCKCENPGCASVRTQGPWALEERHRL